MEGVGGVEIYADGGELGRFGGAGYGGQRVARNARKWKFDVRRFFAWLKPCPDERPVAWIFFANEFRRLLVRSRSLATLREDMVLEFAAIAANRDDSSGENRREGACEECLRSLAQTAIIIVSALMREPHGEAFRSGIGRSPGLSREWQNKSTELHLHLTPQTNIARKHPHPLKYPHGKMAAHELASTPA